MEIRDGLLLVRLKDGKNEIVVEIDEFRDAIMDFIRKDKKMWERVVKEVYDSNVWVENDWCLEVR